MDKMGWAFFNRLTRSGNPVSIGLYKACRKLKNDYKDDISQAVFSNLELLTEIRDNSIHLVDKTGAVELKIQEIATASLVNYIALARQWFGVDSNIKIKNGKSLSINKCLDLKPCPTIGGGIKLHLWTSYEKLKIVSKI